MTHYFLLDTNVWSEVLRKEPHPAVLAWFNENRSQARMSLTTVMELQYGISRMPRGKRRNDLESAITALLAKHRRQIIGYDFATATRQAEIRSAQFRNGLNTTSEDQQIAAAAFVNGMVVATRNIKDFKYSEVRIVNPWNGVHAEIRHS